MPIYFNKFAYNYANDGSIESAEVDIYGTGESGQFVSASLLVTYDDLEGKSFDDLTVKQVEEIARQKLIGYLKQPVGSEG